MGMFHCWVVAFLAVAATAGSLPTTFDWRTRGVVAPVFNQGQCGSTWAVAALQTLESVCAIAGYGLKELSVQQLLDCVTSSDGCNGGFPMTAYDYIGSNGGLDSASAYPYKAQNDHCAPKPGGVVDCSRNLAGVLTLNYTLLPTEQAEAKLQAFIYSNSPIMVCVNAEPWETYTGGVMTAADCNAALPSQNHCVAIVGWTVVDGASVWIAENMWGSNWGEKGYIYLELGKNTCNLLGVNGYPPLAPCVNDPTGKIVC